MSELPGKPKKTGVGSLSLLQEIFLTQESNWGLLHRRQILYQQSYQEIYQYLIPFYCWVIYIYHIFIHSSLDEQLDCFHFGLLWALSWNQLIASVWVYFWILNCIHWSVYLYLCQYHTASHYSYVISSKIGKCEYSNFVLVFQDSLFESLEFSWNFRIGLYFHAKQEAVDWYF